MNDGHELIAILDFGSQYTQLIARRIRENHVYCEVFRPDVAPEELRRRKLRGVILSGGPASVYAADAPQAHSDLLTLSVPILGICYGMQVIARQLGGAVEAAQAREFGRVRLRVGQQVGILAHVPAETNVWMSHGDLVTAVDDAFEPLASTDSCKIAAVGHRTRPIFGVQFHPEVTHTPSGAQILRNFAYDICGCTGDWRVSNFIEESVQRVQTRVGADERVICGLSGGVDSSVVAALLHRALGERLVCIFVDNGLLRRRESEMVRATFQGHFGVSLRVAEAQQQFLTALAGVHDPQEKRRIIGREFITAFRAEAQKIPNARYLAQGTIYPDVIESGHGHAGTAATIKSHHNVGGLPAELGFELIEPLRMLFKDEVRQVGEALGLPRDLVWRHPFPGPGLAVRIAADVTPERLEILRAADEILLEELTASGWYDKIAQAFVVLAPVESVGVMGDGRTYSGQHLAAIRLVESTDFMTADWVRMDYEILARVSSRIVNEVRGVNRVVYDVTTKPPATIEWQ